MYLLNRERLKQIFSELIMATTAMYGGSGNIAGNLKNGFNWNIYGTSKSAG
jgi:hypothetical protein